MAGNFRYRVTGGGRFIHESCSAAHEAKTSWLSCIKLPDPSTMWSYWSMCPPIQTAWVAFHLEWATCAAQPSSDKHPGTSTSRLKWIFGKLLRGVKPKQGHKLLCVCAAVKASGGECKQLWNILLVKNHFLQEYNHNAKDMSGRQLHVPSAFSY